jgi:hypothetical protein
MELVNFEERLEQMTKPEISQLNHQDMLAKALLSAKDKSAVSWWWLCVPLYIIAALLMKSFYTHTRLLSNIHEMRVHQKYMSLLFFVLVPVAFMVVNLLTIRRIYFLSGSPKRVTFLLMVWFNVLMIILSLFLLIIYF